GSPRRPAGLQGRGHADRGAGSPRRCSPAHPGPAPARRQDRRPRRSAPDIDPPHVGHRPRHPGAGAVHPRQRAPHPRPGLAPGLRAVPDADRAPDRRPGPGVPRGLSGARARCPGLRDPSTAPGHQVMGRRAVIGWRGRTRRLLGLAACIGLAGCAVSDPTRYYTLGPVTAPKAEAGAAAPPSRDRGVGTVSVGVGPVIMPAYLDRVQIVTRTDADQVDLSMFNRWAEPLQDGMARVLAEEIGARVPTERVVTFPWRGSIARIIQYQVVVAVARFDGRPGADVTLDTRC